MQDGETNLTRPQAPNLDEILGKPLEVLDQGFVRVVDYMGNDAAVVQAARVSYGEGTKSVSDDRGLIRYLLRHHHSTPFEMCELKLHVRVPMDAWRQWIRHRTACLAEGTEVYFDLPSGVKRRGNQLYKLRIEEIWRRCQPTENRSRPDKQRNPYFRRDRLRQMQLRQVNEDSLAIQHTGIVDVFRNGPRPVFRFHLSDGKSIEATADHRFLFRDGWSTFKERANLVERSGIAFWDRGDYHLHVNGRDIGAMPPFRDREWLDTQYNQRKLKIEDIAAMCGVSYHTIRKWLRVHSLQHAKGGRSKEPWNKGRSYNLGRRRMTEEHLASLRRARSGAASNFWRGGRSTDREAIGRWTTQVARAVHERNGFTCQFCHARTGDLHCHHVVPVSADPTRARDISNLTSLCAACHRRIQGHELEFVEALGGPPVQTEWVPRPRKAWNRLTITRTVQVVNIEYVGRKETYDLEVRGPYHNFIANGIVTHNSVNETSTRYSIAIDAAQRTAADAWRRQASSNRQGSEGTFDATAGAVLSRQEAELQERARAVYQERLDRGVAREQARKDLPLCTYTEAYWKIDLHNLLHFLSLRMDAHAQQEIRDYATVIGEQIVARWVPLVWEAFQDYRFGAHTLSRVEWEILAQLGQGDRDGALAAATAAGWLARSEKTGGLARHRERAEFEAKAAELGVILPWV